LKPLNTSRKTTVKRTIANVYQSYSTHPIKQKHQHTWLLQNNNQHRLGTVTGSFQRAQFTSG